MDRILSFTKVDEYFESLATRNVDIKDYCGTSLDELLNKHSSVDGVQSPTLVFFNYQGKLQGNTQRTFNNRTLSFAILFAGIGVDDYVGQRNAKTNAERIGLEVLSRINYDSKSQTIGWLYNNFDPAAVRYEEADPENSPEGIYGMEFHFDLKVSEPLVATPAQWSDGDLICV